MPEPGWEAGASVRIIGLAKAPQHNGKIGKISAKPGPDGRLGVSLGSGQTLAVKREHLQLCGECGEAEASAPAKRAAPAAPEEPPHRTLKRDNSMLREFDGTPDPDALALYYHVRDAAYDCFNAAEYHTQMVRYMASGMKVVAVVPRVMEQNPCFLVCLQQPEVEKNSLCDVAFQCMRQFAGTSMLVKQRCFVCNKPGAPRCACHVACYCSKECEKSGWDTHRKLHQLIMKQTPSVTVEEECVKIF